MLQAAIYVKDPLAPRPGIIPKEDQETACREFCTDNNLTPRAVYADPAGSTDQLHRLLAVATSPEAPFDAIVVWKTSRIAVSLEDTIELRDRLRKTGTKLLSATEIGIDD